jgi:hypothetical protein
MLTSSLTHMHFFHFGDKCNLNSKWFYQVLKIIVAFDFQMEGHFYFGSRIRVVFVDVFQENHVQKTSPRHPGVWTNVRVGRSPTDGMGGRPIGRPWQTAPGGWSLVDGPWRTAVVDEEVENLEEKALHLLQHFLPLVARVSKSSIGFQGQRANFRCIGP